MIVFAAGLFCVISSATGLLQPKRECGFFSADIGERVTVETEYLTPCVYEIEHKVNFIPAGREYYYAFMSSDGRAYLARLNGSFGDGLDGEGFRHVSQLCLCVTGKVKRLKASAELGAVVRQCAEEGVELDGEYYLDTIYQVNYLWRIAIGIGFLIFSGALFVNFRTIGTVTAATKFFFGFAVIAGILSMLGGVYLLNMG